MSIEIRQASGKMGGYITEIQHFSIQDGKGIRTTCFLAGCPLKCSWCANPEGQSLNNCFTSYWETDRVIDEILKDRLFYRNSGGGVTFSGGEATYQLEFFKELVERCYNESISCALETCGFFDYEKVSGALEKMDQIFFDLKVIDSNLHKIYTGTGNELILENLVKVYELSQRQEIDFTIRIPCVLGKNVNDELIEISLCFLKEHAPKSKVEFLPYHELGIDKYRELGLKYDKILNGTPTKEQILKWEKIANKYGIESISY